MEKICATPVIPRKENQSSITGPKALPIVLVPLCWTENSAVIMQRVMMTTFHCPVPRKRSIAEMLRNPSTAVVTVTAGVRTPSASSAAPPSIAGTISHFPQFLTSEYREKIPPSPWLSAFIAIRTYFTVVSSVIVQMTRDSEPMMNCASTSRMPPFPSKMDFITYIGEVPMSPYTIPIVTRNMPKRNFCRFSILSYSVLSSTRTIQ